MVVELQPVDWRTALLGRSWDVLISDPPYGKRTHKGQSELRHGLGYDHFTRADVCEFVELLAPRTRGWFCVMTSHDLIPTWEQMLEAHGRYVFAPLPCVIPGMTVRLRGDGPSSWSVWLLVARPRNKEFASWGTLPGAYMTTRKGTRGFRGSKPLELMRAVVSSYSRDGDLIADPCAGTGTTLIAAHELGRHAVGCEVDEGTYRIARDRIRETTGIEVEGEGREMR